MGESEIRSAIKAHLVRVLGPPGETLELAGNPRAGSRIQRVEVPFFRPEQHVRHAVFATIGGSMSAMADGGRVEGLWIVRRVPERSELDAILALLASFVTYAETNGVVLDAGDVIPAEGMLASIAPMTHLLLVPPLPLGRDLGTLVLADGTRIDLLWLLPIYAHEAEHARARGVEPLIAGLVLAGLDPTDLGREPLDVTRPLPDLDAVRADLAARGESKKPSWQAESGGDVIRITRRGSKPRT